MDYSYVAYGLALRSSFSLPGMERAAGVGLPSLALELETPAEMEAHFGRAPGSPPWRGRLGDGRRFTIEQGIGGDLLFTCGERDRFRLDPFERRLGCAPLDVARLDWQRVLLNRVLPNVSISHGREALHASAVETPLGVVAIAAPSGMGKSTLASELMRRGRPLFADDVLILAKGPQTVEAQPASPHMNLHTGACESEEFGAALGVFAGERWIAVRASASQARQVAAIVILERGPGLDLAAEPLPSSPLPLAPYMLGLPDDDERDASRFALYSDLVDSARLFHLTAGTAERPVDLADAVEQALELGAPFAAQGVA